LVAVVGDLILAGQELGHEILGPIVDCHFEELGDNVRRHGPILGHLLKILLTLERKYTSLIAHTPNQQ
jgi:hypothetical protein